MALLRSRYAATLVALMASALAPSGASAQMPPGLTRSYVQTILLKPDMVSEWLDLQRNEVLPAQKKAGVTSRTTLVTQVGESFEYSIITPFPTWSAMDGDAPLVRALGRDGAAQLNAKLRKCILVQQSYMTTRRDSLSVPAGDVLVWRVAIRQFAPGKTNEYLAHYKAEVLPAMQKAKAAGKIAGSTLATRGVGAPQGEFVEVTHYTKFAEIDGGNPLTAVLGAAAATTVAAKGAALAPITRVVVRRRLADLSF